MAFAAWLCAVGLSVGLLVQNPSAAAAASLATLLGAGALTWREKRSIRKTVAGLHRQVARFNEDVGLSVPGEKPSPRSLHLEAWEASQLISQWEQYCHQCRFDHEEEMRRAEHLASVGEIAAGLAHEIRNPLAGIAGAIDIISYSLAADHPDREILGDLRIEVKRIEKVLNDLLAYARPRPPKLELADLRETVHHGLLLAEKQAGAKKIRFTSRFAEDLPPIEHDPEQIHQVLLNLLLNAIQAIRKEGEITVEARVVKGASEDAPCAVELAVRDNGEGIPPEQLQKIFKPFFTTKSRGTGLGLSLCRRVIQLHGGSLTARNESNGGCRFTIRLPLAGAPHEVLKAYAL